MDTFYQSANYYREIMNQARDIILIMCKDGKIIDANEAAVKAYGYSRIELMALTIQDLRNPATLVSATDQMQIAFTEGIIFETSHCRKDGSFFPVEVSSHRMIMGSKDGLISIIRDITQRIDINETLRREAHFACEREGLFEKRYEAIAAGVIVQDTTGKIIYANAAASHILGMSIEELLGKVSADPDWMAIDTEGNPFPPEKHPITITLKTGEAVYDVIHGIRNRKTRETRWLLMTAKPIRDASTNQMLEAIVTFIDITELRKTQKALQESEEVFRSLFSNMAEGVALHEIILDDAGIPCNYRIVEVNTSYETTLGLKREDIIGKLATDAYETATPPYLQEYSQVATKNTSMHMETYFEPLDKHFAISITSWGKNGFATIFSDVTEIKNAQKEMIAANAKLEELASTDRLTGIWNRRYFEKNTAIEMNRAEEYHQQISLVLFDIDHFKHINDNYGHPMGDYILVEVSRLIQDNIRASDSLARWGGDEFIILLPNSPAKDAMKLAEKLRHLIYTYDFSEVGGITLSMGVAELMTEENMSSWIKRADEALYIAKASGRNAVKLAPSIKE